jgi:hypothetical protein
MKASKTVYSVPFLSPQFSRGSRSCLAARNDASCRSHKQ